MADIVLIHGFATGIRYSIFRPPCGIDAGFSAFTNDVLMGTARVFRWDISDDASFWETINPGYSLGVYAKEHNRIQNNTWQERLYSFLESEQASTIVCHSLGCLFLLETMNHFGLPTCVQKVIFNQSGIPLSADLTNTKLRERITSRKLQCINTYCPWDPTLLFSMVIQGVIRDGLIPSRKEWLINKFIPLLRPINLHTSAIRSPRFRNWVKQKS